LGGRSLVLMADPQALAVLVPTLHLPHLLLWLSVPSVFLPSLPSLSSPSYVSPYDVLTSSFQDHHLGYILCLSVWPHGLF